MTELETRFGVTLYGVTLPDGEQRLASSFACVRGGIEDLARAAAG